MENLVPLFLVAAVVVLFTLMIIGKKKTQERNKAFLDAVPGAKFENVYSEDTDLIAISPSSDDIVLAAGSSGPTRYKYSDVREWERRWTNHSEKGRFWRDNFTLRIYVKDTHTPYYDVRFGNNELEMERWNERLKQQLLNAAENV